MYVDQFLTASTVLETAPTGPDLFDTAQKTATFFALAVHCTHHRVFGTYGFAREGLGSLSFETGLAVEGSPTQMTEDMRRTVVSVRVCVIFADMLHSGSLGCLGRRVDPDDRGLGNTSCKSNFY